MLNHRIMILLVLLSLLMIGGCATVPTGPSVMVLPSTDKPFEVFQAEDAACRQWAAQQIGLSPQQMVEKNTVSGAVVGTIIGAGLGAAIGSTTGDAGAGAAIGGASGLVLGTASGAESARVYGWEAQRRYDIAYMQCMYSKGNQIPGVVTRTRSIQTIPPPPEPDSVPPTYYPSYPTAPPPSR
jgi:hypothetical protein